MDPSAQMDLVQLHVIWMFGGGPVRRSDMVSWIIGSFG